MNIIKIGQLFSNFISCISEGSSSIREAVVLLYHDYRKPPHTSMCCLYLDSFLHLGLAGSISFSRNRLSSMSWTDRIKPSLLFKHLDVTYQKYAPSKLIIDIQYFHWTTNGRNIMCIPFAIVHLHNYKVYETITNSVISLFGIRQSFFF